MSAQNVILFANVYLFDLGIAYQTTGRDAAICIAAGNSWGAQSEDFALVSGGRLDSLFRGRPYRVNTYYSPFRRRPDM